MRSVLKTLALVPSPTAFAQTFTYTQIDVPNLSRTSPFGSNSYDQIVGLAPDGDGKPARLPEIESTDS